MATNLMIVESPSKIKTIMKYLATLTKELGLGTFEVVASYGHIRDLQKKNMGVDIEHGFEPAYQVISDKHNVIQTLQQKAAKAQTIWLASDLDREGEGIAWHVRELLLQVRGRTAANFKRITFHEITKPALEEALRHPRQLNMDLVDAQKARRVLDRIVGFKLTQLLWKVFTANTLLTAGRVQSVVLDLIVAREDAVAAFKTEAYWHGEGSFSIALKGLSKPIVVEEAGLYDKKQNKMARFDSEAAVKTWLSKLGADSFSVDEASISELTQKPEKPYITSTLQQDAYSKAGLSIQRCMRVAQDLYEAGHITYMRTDSYHLSEGIVGAIKEYVTGAYGQEYIASGAKAAKEPKAAKNAQEAHEAIRPTHIDVPALTTMSKEHQRLYELIWKRTVASVMAPAVFQELTLDIAIEGHKQHVFKGKFKNRIFPGFQVLYDDTTNNAVKKGKAAAAAPLDFEDILDKVQEESTVVATQIQVKQTWSVPPARYNESAIVKQMEKDGIGRPSTYGAILQKLYERQYIETRDIEGPQKDYHHFTWTPTKGTTPQNERRAWFSEKGKLCPTAIGTQINTFLRQSFPLVMNVQYTADMESKLDRMAQGQEPYLKVMTQFYKPFMEHYDNVKLPKDKESKQELEGARRELKVDGTTYIIRYSRFGPVIEYDAPDQAACAAKKKAPTKKKTTGEAAAVCKEFISLKPFMQTYRKPMEEVSAEDIKFLRSFPQGIGKGVQAMYGPYGFYLSNGVKEKNRKLYPKLLEHLAAKEYAPLHEYFATEKKAPRFPKKEPVPSENGKEKKTGGGSKKRAVASKSKKK